jgi:dienelactone hydrolase
MTVKLTATPATAQIDEPLRLDVRGLPPDTTIALHASLRDPRGTPWKASDVLAANRAGSISIDAADLIASLTIANDEPARPFDATSTDTLEIEFRIEADGRTVASTRARRQYVAETVSAVSLQGPGPSGLLFEPADEGPRPAVIVLGGSSGGLLFASQTAALLASHGFVALALAYFGYGNLPPYLIDIPIEYFTDAIAWLSTRPTVRKGSLGVLGISRGAELALILGAASRSVRAVVAYSPSSVVWNGLRAWEPSDMPAWTTAGVPIPYFSLMAPRLAAVRARAFGAAPVELKPIFDAALADTLPAEVMIPVERTNGPILLVSGENDRMWPSTRMGEQVMERLAANKHPYPSRHLHFTGAGHLMRAPGVSTAILNGHFALGGERVAQARANRESWTATLSFLAGALQLHSARDLAAAAGGSR